MVLNVAYMGGENAPANHNQQSTYRTHTSLSGHRPYTPLWVIQLTDMVSLLSCTLLEKECPRNAPTLIQYLFLQKWPLYSMLLRQATARNGNYFRNERTNAVDKSLMFFSKEHQEINSNYGSKYGHCFCAITMQSVKNTQASCRLCAKPAIQSDSGELEKK